MSKIEVFNQLDEEIKELDTVLKVLESAVIKEELEEHGIGHSTIEIELENEKCHDKDCEIKPNKVHHHHNH